MKETEAYLRLFTKFYLLVKFSWNVYLSILLNIMFHAPRPFIVITFSTGLVGVEVITVSWLGQLTVGV